MVAWVPASVTARLTAEPAVVPMYVLSPKPCMSLVSNVPKPGQGRPPAAPPVPEDPPVPPLPPVPPVALPPVPAVLTDPPVPAVLVLPPFPATLLPPVPAVLVLPPFPPALLPALPVVPPFPPPPPPLLQPFIVNPAAAPITSASHFAPKFFMSCFSCIYRTDPRFPTARGTLTQLARSQATLRKCGNGSGQQGEVEDRLQAGRRRDDRRDRGQHRTDGAAIAVRAAADDDVEGRITVDDDGVARVGCADRHLEVEADDLPAAAHADRRLAQARHPAGFDAGAFGDHRIDRRPDVVQHQAEAETDQRARFGEAAVPEAARGDAGSELVDGQAGADLGAQRAAPLGGVDDARDLDVIDADAGGRQRQRQAIHHEAGIDAGADDGDARLAGARVDAPGQLGRGEIGVREILAGGDDVDARCGSGLDHWLDVGNARAGQHQRHLGTARERLGGAGHDGDAARPDAGHLARVTPGAGRIRHRRQPQARTRLDGLQDLAPDRAKPDDRDVHQRAPFPLARPARPRRGHLPSSARSSPSSSRNIAISEADSASKRRRTPSSSSRRRLARWR